MFYRNNCVVWPGPSTVISLKHGYCIHGYCVHGYCIGHGYCVGYGYCIDTVIALIRLFGTRLLHGWVAPRSPFIANRQYDLQKHFVK